jgi:hypothetical protein
LQILVFTLFPRVVATSRQSNFHTGDQNRFLNQDVRLAAHRVILRECKEWRRTPGAIQAITPS